MTRAEFLNNLYRRLGSLSREKAEKHLTYYAEMLADRMEEGMSEAEAVASMEDLDTIVQRILQDEGAQPPRYPNLPETEPSQPEQNAVKKSGRDWRKMAGIALWAAAITIAVSVLWNRFSPEEALPDNSNSDWGATEEPDTGFHIDANGIYSDNFSIGPDGIYASGGGHEVYIGPGGIRVDGVDGVEEWAAGTGDYIYSGEEYLLPTDGIREINIEWTAGDVSVESFDGDAIQFWEDSTAELTDRNRMTYETKGKTLTIRCWQGRQTQNMPQKRLTLLVPSRLLDSLDVEATSANIQISALQLDSLEINCTSGDVALLDVTAQSVEVDTVSGGVNGNVAAKEVEVDTTSGDVCLYSEQGDSFHLNSTSGDLFLCVTDQTVSEMEVDTVSGDVTLELSWDLGFTLTFETVSGSLIANEHSLTWKDGRYIQGSGRCEIEVVTTSGDLNLL